MYPHFTIKDFSKVDRLSKKNWEHFVTNSEPEVASVRDVVLSSWERCKNTRLPVNINKAPTQLGYNAFKTAKAKNQMLLQAAQPVLKDMRNHFDLDGLIMVLSDNDGVILQEEANTETVREFDKLNFSTGANWSEKDCGTNAIGTALATKSPVTIFSAEHYCEGWHHLVCNAATINDPFVNETLGVIDLTGKKELLGAHNALIIHAAKGIIEQSLEQEFIRSKNGEAYISLSHNTVPAVAFTTDGTITRFNELAQIMFQIKRGMNFPRTFHLPESSRIDSQIKVSLKFVSDFNKEWAVRITPHFIDNKLCGGVATFTPFTATSAKIYVSQSDTVPSETMIYKSRQMSDTVDKAEHAAKYEFPVLINGSTGTGKERIAEYIHRLSSRNNQPFIAVNCGAIPKELIASELFGYVPGAFTGADNKGKKGKILQADKGVLFLDEIAELPQEIQPYLLRFLEEKTFYPVGSDSSVHVNCRIISATHKNLENEVLKGNFREDLYYRLNVINLHIDDIQQRPEDILPLFEYFVEKNAAHPIFIHPKTKEKLLHYSWPGNVREIKNTAEYCLFSVDEGYTLSVEHLPEKIIYYEPEKHHDISLRNYSEALNPAQQLSLIQSTLKQTNGNVSKAAHMLNISRMTIYRKLKETGNLLPD